MGFVVYVIFLSRQTGQWKQTQTMQMRVEVYIKQWPKLVQQARMCVSESLMHLLLAVNFSFSTPCNSPVHRCANFCINVILVGILVGHVLWKRRCGFHGGRLAYAVSVLTGIRRNWAHSTCVEDELPQYQVMLVETTNLCCFYHIQMTVAKQKH